MGKSKFQPDWLNKPSYATWLAANRNAFSAYCQVCRSNFDVTAMGEAAVRSHSTGKRHLANVRRRGDMFASVGILPKGHCDLYGYV